MAINLNSSAFSLVDSVFVQLKDPVTDSLLFSDEAETIPAGIEVYSKASKQYREAINAMQNRTLKRQGKQVSAEVLREESTDLLVKCSVKAVGLEHNGTDEIDNAEAFRTLYKDPKIQWIRDQVDAALGSNDLFLQK